jgi:hypothetical protein
MWLKARKTNFCFDLDLEMIGFAIQKESAVQLVVRLSFTHV